MQIIHLISDILNIYSVGIEGCVVVAYLERSALSFSQFFELYFIVCKFYKLGLTWAIFHLGPFSISIYKISKSIHHLVI